MSDNTITLAGNLTRDPELRYMANGAAKVTFGLAVERRRKVGDQWESESSFFDVVCWKELAENVGESLTKGTRVVVSGRLEQRSWEAKDGAKRSTVEVVADDVGASMRWAACSVSRNERRGTRA